MSEIARVNKSVASNTRRKSKSDLVMPWCLGQSLLVGAFLLGAGGFMRWCIRPMFASPQDEITERSESMLGMLRLAIWGWPIMLIAAPEPASERRAEYDDVALSRLFKFLTRLSICRKAGTSLCLELLVLGLLFFAGAARFCLGIPLEGRRLEASELARFIFPANGLLLRSAGSHSPA